MKSHEMTYKSLFDEMQKNPNNEYYVETPNGEYSLINACVEKRSDTYTIEFYNGTKIKCGDKHAFMDHNGNPVTAEDLEVGQKVQLSDGSCIRVKNKNNFEKDQPVFDISIDSPHWYTNSKNGIVHHNTMLGLMMVKAYMDKYPDAICLFYDTEFGTPPNYLNSQGIDLDRVLHTPVMHIEQLKFDLMKQLNGLTKEDKVIVFIDSVGNVASKKEVDDAEDMKSVADMTRAKALKSLFRMTTPKFKSLDIPCITVNHVYRTQEMFSKDVVSGGCLLPGTKIIMSNGEVKNIEDIVVGDTVKTLNEDKPVTHTWNPETLLEGEPECYRVTFEDGSYVDCSDSHKFLVNGEWVEAKDLVVGSDALSKV